MDYSVTALTFYAVIAEMIVVGALFYLVGVSTQRRRINGQVELPKAYIYLWLVAGVWNVLIGCLWAFVAIDTMLSGLIPIVVATTILRIIMVFKDLSNVLAPLYKQFRWGRGVLQAITLLLSFLAFYAISWGEWLGNI